METTHPQNKLDFNYITDGIYVGTNQCCQMHFDEALEGAGMTYDISLEKDRIDAPFGVISYVWIPVEDHQAPTPEQIKFGVSVLEKIVAMGKKVYVHCKRGHGRAPTLAAAYLIKNGKTVEEAIEFIKLRRPLIHLEDAQKKALEEFSNLYKTMKQNLILPISIIVAGILIAGTIFYTGTGNSRNVQGNIGNNIGNTAGNNIAPHGGSNVAAGAGREVKVDITETDPFLGNKNAPVTLIAFEDFECPFCRRFSTDTLPLLAQREIKEGKVRVVWKDFPLSIHSNSQKAHEAARCAWEQGKFWEYHDLLFGNQNNIGVTALKGYAKNLGLNESQFASCLDSDKYASLIREKSSQGSAAGVSGTPSFLINGRVVVGAQPYQTFADAINQAAQK